MNHKNFQDIVYIPLTWFLYLLSFLPLWFLYIVAGIVGFMLHRVFGYRRAIVRENLQHSFPNKTEQERKEIEKNFYMRFSEVLVEVIKLRTISFANLKHRCYYSEESVALMQRFYDEGKSVMIVMGHMGNWEWAGSAFPLYNRHQVITAYRPLRNKTIDRDTLKMRKRTGNNLAPMKTLHREMLKNLKNIFATALIADQTPPKDNAYWIKFLNQETPFYKGTELLSKRFNSPLLWGSVIRKERGYYNIKLELITNQPGEHKREGSLTCLYASYLERDIVQQPESWLWSHRRWKHKRLDGYPLVDSENQRTRK